MEKYFVIEMTIIGHSSLGSVKKIGKDMFRVCICLSVCLFVCLSLPCFSNAVGVRVFLMQFGVWPAGTSRIASLVLCMSCIVMNPVGRLS